MQLERLTISKITPNDQNSWSGILIAIDFEKAFDTLDFEFLIRTLHKFNFSPSFIQWLRVLYKNASSYVMNNGFTTGPFLLGRESDRRIHYLLTSSY